MDLGARTGVEDACPEPTALLRVDLLGAFRVSVGEREIADDAWRLRKAASLVKLLALAQHQTLQRDELLEILWPDLDPQSAANNLRYALHVARRILEPAPDAAGHFLRWQGERLLLARDAEVRIDALEFERAAQTARRVRQPAAFQRAIELYSGDLLPEERYEDWAAGRREVLREPYLTLLLELARLQRAARDYRAAIEVLRRAIAADPTREEAHVALMRAYAAIGQRQLALRQYQSLRDVLRADLDALAMELATARMPVLPVEQIASRLDGALELLTGGGRTVVARQRTLRGVLDWSHRLLTEPERALLARLAVFSGGWTLEAAEAIATDPRTAPEDSPTSTTLDVLSELVDKSLVVAAGGAGGVTRYRLLEPVRLYAWDFSVLPTRYQELPISSTMPAAT